MKYTIPYNRILFCIGILLAIIIWSLYQCKNPIIIMDHVKEYFDFDLKKDILSPDTPIKLRYNNSNYISVTFNYKNLPIVKTVSNDQATNFYVDYMGKHENSINTYCMYIKQKDTQDEKNYSKKYITCNFNNKGELINNNIYFDDIGGTDNQIMAFDVKGTTKICFLNKNKNKNKKIMFLDYNSNTNTLELAKIINNSNLTVHFEPPSGTSTEYTQKAIVYRNDFPNTEHNTEHNTSNDNDYITGSGYGDIIDNNKLIPYFKNVWETQSDTKWYSNDESLSISFTEFNNNNKTCTVEFSNDLKNVINTKNSIINNNTLEATIISSNLIMFGGSSTSYKIFFQIVPTPDEKYVDNRENTNKILHPLYYLQVWAIKNEDPLTRINLFYRKKFTNNNELKEDENGYFIKVHEKDIKIVQKNLPTPKPLPLQTFSSLGTIAKTAGSFFNL